MYFVTQSKFNGHWLVINNGTNIAQSAWINKRDAFKTAYDLNRARKMQLVRAKFHRW